MIYHPTDFNTATRPDKPDPLLVRDDTVECLLICLWEVHSSLIHLTFFPVIVSSLFSPSSMVRLNIAFIFLFMCLFSVQWCFLWQCVCFQDSCVCVCMLEVSQGSAKNDGAVDFTISAPFTSDYWLNILCYSNLARFSIGESIARYLVWTAMALPLLLPTELKWTDIRSVNRTVPEAFNWV